MNSALYILFFAFKQQFSVFPKIKNTDLQTYCASVFFFFYYFIIIYFTKFAKKDTLISAAYREGVCRDLYGISGFFHNTRQSDVFTVGRRAAVIGIIKEPRIIPIGMLYNTC